MIQSAQSNARISLVDSRSRLSVRSLCAGWGRTASIHALNLDLEAGQRLAVLGPNGAGKTTLFDALSGRLGVREGSVRLGFRVLDGLPLYERARLGLGYVPQESTVFAERSVEKNLWAALQAPAAPKRGRDEATAELEGALCHWGLEKIRGRKAGVLSGGERRRVEVARALLLRPRVLLLDEPFAGLDPQGRSRLREALANLPEPRPSLLITDHSAEDLLDLCEQLMVLVDGRVAYLGASSAFTAETGAFRRYFGT